MTRMLLISIQYFLICVVVEARNIHYNKESSDVCNQYFNITSCYYFSCIDSIYQCGKGNLLVQFSYPFCEALLERTYNSLTRPGQVWAASGQTCLIQELNYYLKSNPSSTCTEIDRYTLNKYPTCLTQSHPVYSLCSVICNNLEIFLEIFDNWTLQSLNLKRFFLDISHLCQEQSQMEYVIDIRQSNVRTILWSLCLDSFKTKFENFHPNEILIKINENPGMFNDQTEEDD